jgi:hypothetical protein
VNWSQRPAFLACLLGLSLIAAAESHAAEPVFRPISARGEAAQTLIVFDSARAAYSLGSELEFLKLQLRRVATDLEAIPASNATSNRLSAADYLVVFCPQPDPAFSADWLAAVANLKKPVLWVGYGTELLGNVRSRAEEFERAFNVPTRFGSASYRGRQWFASGNWIPMLIASNSTAEVGIQVGGRRSIKPSQPLSWKVGESTCFSGVPAPGDLGFLFADLLLDFYGTANVSGARIFLRIDDYRAASNHREFRRWVDYLYSRGHSFFLSVTPSWRSEETNAVPNLDSAPEFVAGLRYAQKRGGRILLRGCVREPVGKGEFWNLDLDRPPAENQPSVIRERLITAVNVLLKHGLLPVAWQTPDDAASQTVYREVAQVFSTAVERPQLGDITHREKGVVSALTLDGVGRLIVPENLGYVSSEAADPFGTIRRHPELLTALRGTVAGCFIHAYQPFDKLTGVIEILEKSNRPFLDPADLDNSIHTPGHLLLTGRAQRTLKVTGDTITWKAFDRGGNLLMAEQESVAPGEYRFQRKGKGDYELFEFSEATQ